MTDINKQKFLAELGKLLTFMYEEDRQQALQMYSDIFDQAEDGQALMNHLVSPTRQAVIIARAYNAKERKLQIHAQSRDESGVCEDSGETPAFIDAIAENLPFALCREENNVDTDQFSFFDDGENPVIGGQEPEAVEVLPLSAEEEEVPEAAETEEEAETAEAEPEEEELKAPAPEAESTGEDEEEEPEAPNLEAQLSAFENEVSEQEEPKEEKSAPEEEPLAEAEALAAAPIPEPEMPAPEMSAPAETVLKARVFLLIIYVLFAVPITAAGLILLLIPTLLFMLLAGLSIYGGSVLLIGAFSGFAVFADIMVVLGAATVVLAIGLLFFWFFIWFIGGAMASLVRLALELGKKWCYKEVPAV